MQQDLESLRQHQERQSLLVEEINGFNTVRYLLVVAVHQTEFLMRSIGLIYDLNTNINLEYWISKKYPVSHQYLSGFLFLRNNKELSRKNVVNIIELVSGRQPGQSFSSRTAKRE